MINATHGPGASRCNTLGSSGVVLHRVVGTRLGPRQAHSTEKAEVWAKNFSVLAETIQSKKTASEPPFLMGTFYPSTETFFFGCRIPFFLQNLTKIRCYTNVHLNKSVPWGAGDQHWGWGSDPLVPRRAWAGDTWSRAVAVGFSAPAALQKVGASPDGPAAHNGPSVTGEGAQRPLCRKCKALDCRKTASACTGLA